MTNPIPAEGTIPDDVRELAEEYAFPDLSRQSVIEAAIMADRAQRPAPGPVDRLAVTREDVLMAQYRLAEAADLIASLRAQTAEREWHSDTENAPHDGTPVTLLLSSGREAKVRWLELGKPDEEGYDYGWAANGHWALGEDETPIRWRVKP